MTNQLQNVKYGPRQLELNWLNSINHSHDLFCGCDDPLLHFIILHNKHGNAPKPEKDIQNIKCLITGKTTTGDAAELDFEDGELERLFQEEPEEEKTGTAEESTG